MPTLKSHLTGKRRAPLLLLVLMGGVVGSILAIVFGLDQRHVVFVVVAGAGMVVLWRVNNLSRWRSMEYAPVLFRRQQLPTHEQLEQAASGLFADDDTVLGADDAREAINEFLRRQQQ